MATSWTVLTYEDLKKVLSIGVITSANQNTGPDSAQDDPLDTTQQHRAEQLVSDAVAEFRSAVKAAHRFPLSVTAGAVPGMAVPHVLALAGWRLMNSTPNLPTVVLDNLKGWGKAAEEALKFVAGI